MVSLIFDASRFGEPNRDQGKFWLTFGRSRSETRWTDKRDMSFGEIVAAVSHAPVGGKDGTCYTPATFTGTARRMEQASQIDVVVLDADCGHSLEEIQAAVIAKGWRAIIHSTYSHLSDQSIIAAAPAEKWLAEDAGRTIAGYMAAKKGYLPRVIQDARIVDDTADGPNDSRNLIVKHFPCPKFRILLPLAEPWVAENYESQQIANAKWRERIGALAHSLGLNHDQSCVDTSRLFYLPRLRDTDQPFAVKVIEGKGFEDCDIWSLPDAVGAAAQIARANGEAIRPQLVKADHKSFVDGTTGEFVDLTAWAARYSIRFEVMTALRVKAPHVFSSRRTGVKHHIICPNSGDHITSGAEGTGTYVVNSSQVELAGLPGIKSGFVIHCMHNGCASHDRLDHLRALLADGSLSVSDLTDARFLTPDIPQVDASAIVKSMATRPLREAQDATAEGGAGYEASNIPRALYENLPGILGRMHEWTLSISISPQPVLALGAIMSFCGAAIGRRVMIQYWETRSNMYGIGMAYSGAGKERPLYACKKMARAAGLYEKLIGVEEITSDAGIVNSVAKNPNQVMLIDEASFMLSATNAASAGPHMQNVTGTLLKLYSSSHTTYKSKSYADTDKVKIIDQPCVSFYGTSVPGGLTDALSSKDITSGLLSRIVLFDAGGHDPLPGRPSNEPVPQDIVDWLMAWDKVDPIQNLMKRVGGEAVIEPRTVLMTDEAVELVEKFKVEIHAEKISARKRGKDALYVRAVENALKFALIRACASVPAMPTALGPRVDESALRVDATTMKWAIELSLCTVRRMDSATDEISDTGFSQQVKELRKLIRSGGERGLTPREIAKNPAGKHPKKLLDDLFDSMASSGDVYWVTMKTGGRDRQAWVHRQFKGAHNIGPHEEDSEE